MGRRGRIRSAIAAAALIPVPGAAAQTLTFNVSDRLARELDSHRVAPPIAPGFAGVSIDYCSITRYAVAGPNPILDQLLLGLAPDGGVIRIGGDQLGQSCVGDPEPLLETPPVIRSVLEQTHERAILGINFIDGDPRLVAPEVTALAGALDPTHPGKWIEAFEIGNEPDLYPRYGVSLAWQQTRPLFWDYLKAFSFWAAIVRYAVHDPTVGVAGPSLGRLGIPWIHGPFTDDFRAFMSGPARADPITFHTYGLLSQAPCPNPACPTIPHLLANGASHGVVAQIAPYAAWLRDPQQLRVDETNSVTGGGIAGVSNTFASALWILDSLFEYARAGIAGINVHTFPSANYALFSGPRPGGWVVYPEYYGMLAFARTAPAGSRLLAVSPQGAAASMSSVKVWAVRAPSGGVRIVAINKDVVAHTILLRGAGVPYPKTATIAVLKAPRSRIEAICPQPLAFAGACAASGVTFGGASFGAADPAGGDHTSTGVLGPPPPGTCRLLERCTVQPRGSTGAIELTLAPATATFVTGSASPPRKPLAFGARWTASSHARTSAPG